jgi:hypothetical protein
MDEKTADEEGDYEVGYQKPPSKTRFRKGQSGNPRGRPPGRKKELPYEAVLGQMVKVVEDGRESRVTAEEAFLTFLTRKGLEGDGAAARAASRAMEEARARQLAENEHHVIEIKFVAPGSVSTALEALRMGKKLDRHRETVRMALEPWVVYQALERLGERRLSIEEQRIVVGATRSPGKVRWPVWWEVKA